VLYTLCVVAYLVVYLSLSGMAPAYLATDCQLVSDEGRRLLRSATSRTYSNYGDRCFAAAGPRLCFGTAFQLICDKLTLALNNLNGYT